MTQLTTPGSNAIASLQSLRQGLQNVASTIVATGGDPFLRLLKDGQWVYGAENVDVQDGSYWAVNPMSLMHGFVAWTDHPGKQANEIVGEVMVPMTKPLPDRLQLPDVGWPWSQQLQWQVRCLTGEDEGTQVLYKTTSVGGINAMQKLITALMAQLDRDPDKPVPVIELLVDFYQHKKWGRTAVPIFEIKRWVALDAPPVVEPAAKTEAAAPEPAAAPAPRRRARSTPAVKQEPEPAREPVQETAAPWEDDAAKHATVAVDPAAARMAALEAELAALKGGQTASAPPQSDGPAPGQPIRRRRV